MNLSKVDLNLFIVFDAIYTEANLTRAGQIVGITQPAVSNALARLRETFNDPLFVRTAQGMVPTPMAQNIITPVRSALQLLRVSVQESRSFVPEQATKTYRISMTDLTEAVILPHLASRIRRMAPNINIDSFLIKRRETTKELAAGRLDFAIDAPLNTDTQVRHVKLFEDHHVCVMRPGHPLAKKERITLDDYLAQSHIHISSRRNGLGHVDLALGKMGLQRRVVLRSQHYQMAPLVMESTDMVMTVHERFAQRHNLHAVALPIDDVPPIETHLFWHESTDQDPANRWMREQIIELSQKLVRDYQKSKDAAAS
ncbi:MAG TPA: LysR family transcriptional regulator [Pseudomonas sp.]|jgi:DNA-binding transcriptional LysR family regulator|uniref:LysR family transcriptional regulator n=1 Tax=Halopseudomonas pachastrellae TaxID=254161 RepID=A0A1S8DIP5_9GAMM|nr:LysR family transcriptional regulator [Halopseudomonas pachastrellae]MAB43676.1 LysR family transcriptional regulator [Pseudomonadales bacterium]MAP29651.1 LysR family transcriptional regulator [Pseudomonas sp.]MED5493894.1 LysR family transcriptional regulator [Pseudomonadota bacterium]MAQ52567.1 LysR family transcriptional regulator [Pseudomonas sp.]MBB51662.1 LysR family transcriptional regulator [Pseudomonadales bacterium]|tara:strand:+ start:991 stop:1929 length:939 start_codon:yes stop_codon:yes gene_type:complete